MYDELIKRLRNGLPCYGAKCVSCPDRKLCITHYEHEAADAIEELSKELAELKLLTCGCCEPPRRKHELR